jgi:hypothetical protein
VTARVWLQGLACGGAVVLAAPSAALSAILLAPGVLAASLEGGAGQPSARAALLCGAAAAAGPVVGVWQAGQDVGGAIAIASDPAVVATCWAAQAAGWLLAQLAPVVIQLGIDAHAATRAALLRAERARYEAEWGIPPSAGPPART